MKKIILMCLITLGTHPVFSQLTNLDFENWYTDNNGRQQPFNWVNSGSSSFAPATPANLEQTTDAYRGTYAFALSRWGGYFYNEVSQSAPANYRPQGLTGYYKYADGLVYTNMASTTTEVDTATVHVAVTRWNTITASRDTIGTGIGLLTLVPVYTVFSFPITYTSTAPPDSISLRICPTMYENGNTTLPKCAGGNSCDYLAIDDLTVLPEGIASVVAGSSTISPNPVKDILKVSPGYHMPCQVYITDAMGRIVFNPATMVPNMQINVAALKPGFYIVVLKSSAGAQYTKITKL